MTQSPQPIACPKCGASSNVFGLPFDEPPFFCDADPDKQCFDDQQRCLHHTEHADKPEPVAETVNESPSRDLNFLLGTTDAVVWARECCRINPILDEGMMIGWFANAIETGRDAGIRSAAERIGEQTRNARDPIPSSSPGPPPEPISEERRPPTEKEIAEMRATAESPSPEPSVREWKVGDEAFAQIPRPLRVAGGGTETRVRLVRFDSTICGWLVRDEAVEYRREWFETESELRPLPESRTVPESETSTPVGVYCLACKWARSYGESRTCPAAQTSDATHRWSDKWTIVQRVARLPEPEPVVPEPTREEMRCLTKGCANPAARSELGGYRLRCAPCAEAHAARIVPPSPAPEPTPHTCDYGDTRDCERCKEIIRAEHAAKPTPEPVDERCSRCGDTGRVEVDNVLGNVRDGYCRDSQPWTEACTCQQPSGFVPEPTPKPCNIPLDGPSAMHSAMEENGDLDQHIKTQHASVETSGLTGRSG